MDNLVGSTLQKIKIQEQEKELKLKERREFESNIASFEKDIRDTKVQIGKLEKEQQTFEQNLKKLSPQLEIAKIINKAHSSEVAKLKAELEDLKSNINRDIAKVWELRSTYSEAIQKAADEYDVWALLLKPVRAEPVVSNIKPSGNKALNNNLTSLKDEMSINEDRLQTAIARREKAIALRNSLLVEPENGEEFIRIKNALQYSLDKVAKMTNSQTYNNPH